MRRLVAALALAPKPVANPSSKSTSAQSGDQSPHSKSERLQVRITVFAAGFFAPTRKRIFLLQTAKDDHLHKLVRLFIFALFLITNFQAKTIVDSGNRLRLGFCDRNQFVGQLFFLGLILDRKLSRGGGAFVSLVYLAVAASSLRHGDSAEKRESNRDYYGY